LSKNNCLPLYQLRLFFIANFCIVQHDRARAIYKYALEHIPKERAQDLYKNYTIHEKKYGDRTGIEDVIVSKRKFQYEEEVKANPSNYDAWFDYLRLVESEGNADIIRETYERAIANVPPTKVCGFSNEIS
jgi:crooked neck